jgi:tetratricopeptide (TPR) repeat protein
VLDAGRPPVARHHGVFISYASHDAAVAEALVEALERRGIPAWIASRDIPPGGNFAHEIVRAITTADCIALIVSAHSLASPHVRREVNLAIDKRRLLLPFTIDRELNDFARLPVEWRYWLSAVQMAEFQAPDVAAQVVAGRVAAEAAGGAWEGGPHPAAPAPAPGRPPANAVGRGGLFDRPLVLEASAPPSFLLRPQLRAVPLVGREDLLADLEDWTTQPDDLGVRVVTGAGGQGKSRLATELVGRLTGEGWEAGFLRAGVSADVLSRARTGDRPLLLVVDYAETRTSEVEQLLEELMDGGPEPVARVLLLARSAGDWWTNLSASNPRLEYVLETAREVRLDGAGAQAAGSDEIYRLATAAFRERLGLPVGTPPTLRTAGTAELTPLDLHLEALATVLGESGGGEVHGPASSPVQRVLNHERRYWRKAADGAGLGTYDGVDLDRALAAASLCGADTEDQAVAVLSRVEGLAHHGDLVRLARLIRRLYPSTDWYWGFLRPDLLAEELIGQVAAGSGYPHESRTFPAALLEQASVEQRLRALTMLARAAPQRDHVRSLVADLIRASPVRWADAAVAVAHRAADPSSVVLPLQEALEAESGNVEFVLHLLEQIPDETVALADLAATASAYALGYSQKEAESQSDVPRLLDALSNRLSDIGRSTEAAAAVAEAVEQYRHLAEVSPGTFLSDLARSLNNLSNRLSEVGRAEEALPPMLECVQLYRQLLEDDPEEYRLPLAVALGNLANRLADTGRLDEAREAVTESVDRHRSLVEESSERFAPGLASALNNQGLVLLQLGDGGRALGSAEEAVAGRRDLAMLAPDTFTPNLARALSNLAVLRHAGGDHVGAEEAAEEAVALHRRLCVSARDTYLPELATSLNNHAVELAENGHPDRAVATLREAVDAYRGLTARLPEAMTSRFAVMLENLAARLQDIGDDAAPVRSERDALVLPRFPEGTGAPGIFTREFKDL